MYPTPFAVCSLDVCVSVYAGLGEVQLVLPHGVWQPSSECGCLVCLLFCVYVYVHWYR